MCYWVRIFTWVLESLTQVFKHRAVSLTYQRYYFEIFYTHINVGILVVDAVRMLLSHSKLQVPQMVKSPQENVFVPFLHD